MKTPDWFRNVPSVAELLETPRLKRLLEKVNQNAVVTGVRSVLDDVRHEYRRATARNDGPSLTELAERIVRRVLLGQSPHLRPVINATGCLWLKQLGEPPVADAALDSLVRLGRDYCDLECDLATGGAADRDDEAAGLLMELTGAEAALVVSNQASSLWLTLSALAAGKEVVIARSELIETAAGDRLPELLPAMGIKLKEVGTANRITLADYAGAVDAETAAVLRVSGGLDKANPTDGSVPSARPDLAELAQAQHAPLIELLTHGSLLESTQLGLPAWPSVAISLSQGADLVLVEGAGLVGGPECGLILGRRSLVQKLARHPLARTVRPSKLTIAGLLATLQLYRDIEQAKLQIPVLQLLNCSLENLRDRAERLARQLNALPGLAATAVQDLGSVGAGCSAASSADQLPTWCLALQPEEGQLAALIKGLRTGQPAVIGREQGNQLLLDLRTVFPRQDIDLVSAVEVALGAKRSPADQAQHAGEQSNGESI